MKLFIGVASSGSSSSSTFLPDTTRTASFSNSDSEVELSLEHLDEHFHHHGDGQTVHEEVPSLSISQPFNDIGCLIKPSMSTDEVCSSLKEPKIMSGRRLISTQTSVWAKQTHTRPAVLSGHSFVVKNICQAC